MGKIIEKTYAKLRPISTKLLILIAYLKQKKVCNIRKNDIIVFKLRLFIIRVKMKFN